jgi:hypothetical protein
MSQVDCDRYGVTDGIGSRRARQRPMLAAGINTGDFAFPASFISDYR